MVYFKELMFGSKAIIWPSFLNLHVQCSEVLSRIRNLVTLKEVVREKIVYNLACHGEIHGSVKTWLTQFDNLLINHRILKITQQRRGAALCQKPERLDHALYICETPCKQKWHLYSRDNYLATLIKPS